MATLFVTIFWLAKPIMDGMQDGIKWLGVLVTSHLGGRADQGSAEGRHFRGRGGGGRVRAADRDAVLLPRRSWKTAAISRGRRF